MSTPTILLLDDDANTLLALHAILERTAANVIECENENCTLNWCQRMQSKIDLLVADVVLKMTNGPAVVRQVKPLQPLMRLLFISGFSLSELRKRGLLSDEELAPGSIEFLQKPFSPEAFLASVQSLLTA